LPEEARADVIERASIIEFDGGRPRDEAERLAVGGLIERVERRGPASALGRGGRVL